MNELTKELVAMLQEAKEFLEYCGYGDVWERSCAMESKLPERIDTVLAKAEVECQKTH